MRVFHATAHLKCNVAKPHCLFPQLPNISLWLSRLSD